MPSAFRDSKGWIADFRPIRGTGARRRVRVPERILRAGSDPGTTARAFASECERYCRLIDRDPTDTRAVQHAFQIGAITTEDAQSLLQSALPRSRISHLTLLEAAKAHPSTSREPLADTLQHQAALQAFSAWSGITRLEDLTLDAVQRWIEVLIGRGFAWDTRRHWLLWIRRAARYGASVGYPDCLYGFKLNRRGGRPVVCVWSLTQLCQTVIRVAGDWRTLTAIGLMGFVGLSPTELIRLQVGDLEGDVVRVGLHGYKSQSDVRRRDLPLPSIVVEWSRHLTEGVERGLPLIRLKREVKDRTFDLNSLRHYLGPILEAHTGQALPPKHLRKSFATWAIEAGIPQRHVEAYLGHLAGEVAAVTARHYLASARLIELRPVAQDLDRHIRDCLQVLSTPSASG